MVRAGASPTNASSVDFTVTFSEAVTGVDVDDFALTTSGDISGASVTTVTGSDTTYTVTVNTGSGDGTIRLDIPATATITDLVGNALAGLPYTDGEVYTIDKTAPTVQSIVRAGANPTNASSVDFTVTFSEEVTGVDVDDFALTTTGDIGGASVTSVNGAGTTYTVTVNTGSGDGTIGLEIPDGATITDLVGNALAGLPYTDGEVYTIDKTAPTVVSIVTASPSPVYGSTVDFTVTFSEAVTGVDANDFALAAPGFPNAAVSVAGGEAVYTVTVNTGAGEGWVRVDVIAAPTITDLAGNALDVDVPYPVESYMVWQHIPVMADFNGDGKVDVAVFRPLNSTWYIAGQGAVTYGAAGDIAVPADYNGDGKAEIAVYRPESSTWYIAGQGPVAYGAAGDIPVPADYNGDGKVDIAVYRPETGTWYIAGQGQVIYGAAGDIPVPADYNGDGKAEIAVYRPGSGIWYILGQGAVAYGAAGDIPVPADYNGDGKAEIVVYRPENGTWYIAGQGPVTYGMEGDTPVPGDYNGDGQVEIAVFRAENNTWYIRGMGGIIYGAEGDIPTAPEMIPGLTP